MGRVRNRTKECWDYEVRDERQGHAAFSTRKLHKQLHTHCTFDVEQVDLNEKAPIDSSSHWFLMQIGMILGFVTSWPVNRWLLRHGIKEPMPTV